MLFKLSMPPATLASALKALLERLLPSEPALALAHLEAMKTLPRFDMTVMCLPSKDKKLLGAAWPSRDTTQTLALDDMQLQQLDRLRISFRM